MGAQIKSHLGGIWRDADVQLHAETGHLPLQHHHPRRVLGEEHPLQERRGVSSVCHSRLEECQNSLGHQRYSLLPTFVHNKQVTDGESRDDTSTLFLNFL